jgi:hypothetical protein
MNVQDKMAVRITDVIHAWLLRDYDVRNVEAGSYPEGYGSHEIKIKWEITIENAKSSWDWKSRLESSIKTQIISGLQKIGINLLDELYLSDIIIMFDHKAYKKKKIVFEGYLSTFKKVR